MNIEQFRKFSVPLCRSHKTFNKVFGIGANKTGTTSLQQVFWILGLNVAPQQEGELCGVQAAKGHFDDLRRYVDRYDAFQDAPFSLRTTFAQVDALFPRSKFILTVREPEVWFASLLNFHRKIMRVEADRERPSREDFVRLPYIYPGYSLHVHETTWLLSIKDNYESEVDWDLAYDPAHYMRAYVERNRLVVRHFADRPQDLLVVDITREKDTSRIVDFLGLPRQLVTDVPHANRT